MPSEDSIYRPSQEIIDAAHVRDYEALRAEAAADPAAFWERHARELEWYQPWTQVLDDSDAPFYKWFVGCKTNVVLNASTVTKRTRPGTSWR